MSSGYATNAKVDRMDSDIKVQQELRTQPCGPCQWTTPVDHPNFLRLILLDIQTNLNNLKMEKSVSIYYM